MKQLFNIKNIFSVLMLIGLLVSISCQQEKFDYDVLGTHYDGIQNLDEEGIDCGGSSGTPCEVPATCTDGVQNGDETGIDCGGSACDACPIETPRADVLADTSLPHYFTFETADAGFVLEPFTKNADGSDYGQGVDITYGVNNPDGTANDLVAKIIRPDDGRFGGFEDYKFQTLIAPIDFSVYYKWTMDVFIPTGQDFSGSLAPEVVLILQDYDANFFERWTEIPVTIAAADFGTWVTLEFDGTDIIGANGVKMQDQTTYNTIGLRFGGGGHKESGTFYAKDLVPTTEDFNVSKTPRADALAGANLPHYFTFETVDAGLVLEPFTKNADGSNYGQGVDITYGVNSPDGITEDLVAKIIRPDDGRFGGFEDYKFQTLSAPIDFSVYHKWTMEVFIPNGQDFSGSLAPEVVLVLHDYDANFYERWTEIPVTIDAADFGKWVTLEFDGTNAVAVGSGVLLPVQSTYTNVSLRLGGGGHQESGEFYVKDLIPVK
ncbi:hypothetical protein [Polaribacter sp. 11A2H]|uniref:hypothetical protein n=1 Tax=Polaribacter sp. 11A2H TaxID=2687290 RepID=UPI0014074773|nr:hypothetical protein [Polaribacter sp. 11A2H]